MNLIERGTLVYVGMVSPCTALLGTFTTLSDAWAGLDNAVGETGFIAGPCIVPLSAIILIRPATEAEQAMYSKAFL